VDRGERLIKFSYIWFSAKFILVKCSLRLVPGVKDFPYLSSCKILWRGVMEKLRISDLTRRVNGL